MSPGRHAGWRPARPDDWPRLRELLLCAEPAWLVLIDRLESAAPWWPRCLWVLGRSAVSPDGQADLAACFYLNDAGLAIFAGLPVEAGEWKLEGLVSLCRRPLRKLYCLIGITEQIRALQLALAQSTGREAGAANEYLVMVRRPAGSPPRPLPRPGPWPENPRGGFLWRGLDIRRANETDADRLMELQCAYEREEVLVANHQLNRALTRRVLESSLREQCVYCADAGGLMVAKAGTNGRSWNYVQLGGIFTDPAWRRHGIGEKLLGAVLGEIFGLGYGASLFVKNHNHPACALYLKMGFEADVGLSIAYY